MIPNEISAKDIYVTASFGMTDAKKRKPKNRVHRGHCIVCGGDDRILASVKNKYCVRCGTYIKDYLMAKYGVFRSNKLLEAISFIKKPIPCKFKDICGNNVPLFKGGKRNSRRICPTCFKIWHRGFLAGRTIKKNTQGDASFEEFYGELLE